MAIDFTTFSACLTLYKHNFKILHWGASGHKFDRIHKLAEDYSNMVSESLDAIVEMGLRLNQPPVALSEVIETLKNTEAGFISTEYKEFNYEEFHKATEAMLKSILSCIESLHESELVQGFENMGIRSDLEAMHSKYDLEYRYLNARREQ